MKRMAMAFWAALSCAASVPGAEHDLSLSEAIDRALDKNHEIAVQREAVEVAAANLQRADGSYDPEFRLDFQWQDQTEAVNFIFSGAPPGSVGPHNEGVFGQATLSELLPTGGVVTLGTTIGRDTTDNIFTLLTPSYSTFVGIDLRQPILQNREIDPQRRLILVAKLERDRSISSMQAVVADTVAAVERAYWSLVAAERDVLVRAESVRLAQIQETDTKARIEAGDVSESDIAVPQAEIERRRVDLYAARESAQRAALELKTLILDDPADPLWDAVLKPTDAAETTIRPLDVPSQLAAAPGRRPEVAEAEADLERRDVDSRAAKNRVLPRLDLVASYGRYGLAGAVNPNLATFPGFPVVIPPEIIGGLGRSYGTIGDNEFPDATVGFTFSIPIGNRSAKADVAAAEAERRQAAVVVARQKQKVGVEVRTAALAVETAAQSIEAARAGLRAARTQLEAENVRFAAGLTSNYFVLTRQNELAEAARTETAALTGYRKALADYARASGTLLSERHIEFAGDGDASSTSPGAAAAVGPGAERRAPRGR
jgi:outer membrane protein